MFINLTYNITDFGQKDQLLQIQLNPTNINTAENYSTTLNIGEGEKSSYPNSNTTSW